MQRMGFRNIVLPQYESANPVEKQSSNQIPRKGVFSEIEFGAGNKTFKGDERGIWMGSDDFETAPFRVDMDGNIRIKASSITEDISITMYDENDKLSIFLGIKDIV